MQTPPDNLKDYLHTESGNWNNAKTFSISKIVVHLLKIDEYRIICEHGCEQLTDEVMLSEDVKILARLTALDRLIKTTKMLISNSMFALKRGYDRDEVIGYAETLKKLQKLYPMCREETTKEGLQGRKKQIKINEKIYSTILETLNTINEEILYPLNRADLIFKGSEDGNPFEEKQKMLSDLAGDES